MNRRYSTGRTMAVMALSVSALVVLFIAVFAPPAHAAEDIEFRIVFPGDNCMTGSNKLISGPADPFFVEACVTDGGEPVSGLSLTAVVTHVDGTTQVIELTTGFDGVVLYDVVPVDQGATTVVMCIGTNCNFGNVVFEANSPPREIPDNLYTGPTTDMGPSEAVQDGEDDFDDPHAGGPAGAGLGDPAIDLRSFRYLGAEGGVAMFEFQVYGDACSAFQPPPPFGQFSVEVYTPEGGSYFLTYRFQDGGLETYAFNEFTVLDMVDMHLDLCAAESLVILNATGVDVPPGSSFTAGTWLSHDPLSSGYQDFLSGTFIPAVVEEPTTEEPVTEETTDEPVTEEPATEEPATFGTDTPAAISDDSDPDSGGSFPSWIPLLMAAIVAAGIYGWFRSRSPSPTSGGTTEPGVIIDDDSTPGIIVGTRPGKLVVPSTDTPPKIGLRGAKL